MRAVETHFDREASLNHKLTVRESFSKATHSYDSVAVIQKQVVQLIAKQLTQNNSVNRVLDLGSGTSYAFDFLSSAYPKAKICQLDIAYSMLEFARNKIVSEQSESIHAQQISNKCNSTETNFFQAGFVQADFDALPFAGQSFDIIFSSLALQWSQNLTHSLNEMSRIIHPKGKIFMSTLLDGSLNELSQVWHCVDDKYEHVNQNLNRVDIECAINSSALTLTQIEEVEIQQFFPDVKSLMLSLKKLGAVNVHAQRRNSLLGKNQYRALIAEYEKLRQAQGLPLTYRVAICELRKS